MDDIIFLAGEFTGVLILVVLIPALVAGLFRRKSPIKGVWMGAGLILALLLAAMGVLGGGSLITAAIGLSIFALLYFLRVKAANQVRS